MSGEGKKIVETVTLPDCEDNVEDDDGIADTPPVPGISKAYKFSTILKWLEGQNDHDAVCLQLVCGLKQNAGLQN